MAVRPPDTKCKDTKCNKGVFQKTCLIPYVQREKGSRYIPFISPSQMLSMMPIASLPYYSLHRGCTIVPTKTHSAPHTTSSPCGDQRHGTHNLQDSSRPPHYALSDSPWVLDYRYSASLSSDPRTLISITPQPKSRFPGIGHDPSG
jgi:hypothetical protein